MQNTKSSPRIIIIAESITTSTTLLILLSPLSRDITTCSTYERGLAALQQADTTGSHFDLIFMSYPPPHHEQEDTAIQILTMAFLQYASPHHTIILESGSMPPRFSEQYIREGDYVLTRPISRQKLQDVLTPLHLTLPTLNCWEYMQCGREPDGRYARELGICPTAVDHAGAGIHGGKNAGRVCWASGGTLCGGQVQGTFAGKIEDCHLCDFYKLVQTEKAGLFESIDSILGRMRHKKQQ